MLSLLPMASGSQLVRSSGIVDLLAVAAHGYPRILVRLQVLALVLFLGILLLLLGCCRIRAVTVHLPFIPLELQPTGSPQGTSAPSDIVALSDSESEATDAFFEADEGLRTRPPQQQRSPAAADAQSAQRDRLLDKWRRRDCPQCKRRTELTVHGSNQHFCQVKCKRCGLRVGRERVQQGTGGFLMSPSASCRCRK